MEKKSIWKRLKEFFLNPIYPTENKKIIISYFTYRQLIGVLGWSLPFALIILSRISKIINPSIDSYYPSISSYYYSSVRDYFVGALCCASFFLIAYKGNRRIDNWLSTVIGICGIFVPFFPIDTSPPTAPCTFPRVGMFQLLPCTSEKIHIGSATLFFTLLAVNSYFLFTFDAKDSAPDEEVGFDIKKNRDRIYKACGIVLILTLITIGLIYKSGMDRHTIIFYLEAVMLIAFGISWSVKGKGLKYLIMYYSFLVKVLKNLPGVQKSSKRKPAV